MAGEKSKRRRTALFGGTFDPIHSGHLRIAEEAARAFALDRVLLIPAANPPHKSFAALTPYADRLRMVEIACAPYPQFVASALESGPEKSYTIDTLEKAHRELLPDDELFFLIGADAFDEIKTWKRWQDVLQLSDFIVIARPGIAYQIPDTARVHRLDSVQIPVSSSGIRERLASGAPTPELPAEVCEYVKKHRLYGYGTQEPTASR